MTYLDTHVTVWLYFGHVEMLTPAAAAAIEAGDLLISPMVSLEMAYLHEIGRMAVAPNKILGKLADVIGLQVCSRRFQEVAEQAVEERWTRDPFDRLIVAQSRLSGAGLVSRDAKIRQHYPMAIW